MKNIVPPKHPKTRPAAIPSWRKCLAIAGLFLIVLSIFMMKKQAVDFQDYGIWSWITILGVVLSFIGSFRRVSQYPHEPGSIIHANKSEKDKP